MSRFFCLGAGLGAGIAWLCGLSGAWLASCALAGGLALPALGLLVFGLCWEA